jgi:hypothetical protein
MLIHNNACVPADLVLQVAAGRNDALFQRFIVAHLQKGHSRLLAPECTIPW